MSNAIFQSPQFNLSGISIPEFDLEHGKTIRLGLPNFDSKGNSLVHEFRFKLLKHFEKAIPEVKWSKEYATSGFRKLIKSITVEDYIMKELNTDREKAKYISQSVDLNSNTKLKSLILGKRKALAIKCDFEKHETLLFDYYGVDQKEFISLEQIVDIEIKKGKCALIIDRLEYNVQDKINNNNAKANLVRIM